MKGAGPAPAAGPPLPAALPSPGSRWGGDPAAGGRLPGEGEGEGGACVAVGAACWASCGPEGAMAGPAQRRSAAGRGVPGRAGLALGRRLCEARGSSAAGAHRLGARVGSCPQPWLVIRLWATARAHPPCKGGAWWGWCGGVAEVPWCRWRAEKGLVGILRWVSIGSWGLCPLRPPARQGRGIQIMQAVS